MNLGSERTARWMYRGIWSVLVRWFRVPEKPPTLPVPPGGFIDSFRPDPGYLRYLQFWFWLGLLPFDLPVVIVWILIAVALPWLGILLAPVALFLAVAPDIIVYIGIHLRYDTTWYVMTDRSLRIRRGIWVIQETTITFENVQNIKVLQGPVQRHFGFSNLMVETAGATVESAGKGQTTVTHHGMLEGIADAAKLRDRILARVRHSATTGLGDEEPARPGEFHLTGPHLAVLREIRDEVVALAGGAGSR